VRERIARLNGLADSLCVVPPAYALSPQKALFYAGMIAQTFYPS
jgi:hypothetical protein